MTQELKIADVLFGHVKTNKEGWEERWYELVDRKAIGAIDAIVPLDRRQAFNGMATGAKRKLYPYDRMAGVIRAYDKKQDRVHATIHFKEVTSGGAVIQKLRGMQEERGGLNPRDVILIEIDDGKRLALSAAMPDHDLFEFLDQEGNRHVIARRNDKLA